MSNKNLKFGKKNRIALYRNNKIVKLFISQMDCAKYYKLTDPDLSKFLNNKKSISFLNENETLRYISEIKSIKYETSLFKKHLYYLKKNNLLHFYCNNCLNINKECLPLKTFQTVGVCERCNTIQEVSSSSLNKWLLSKNYNLQISDRSKFLKNLMPFDLVLTNLPEIPNEKEIPLYITEKSNLYSEPLDDQKKIEDFIFTEKSKKIEKNNIVNPVVLKINKSIFKQKNIFKSKLFLKITKKILFLFFIIGFVISLGYTMSVEIDKENKVYKVKAIILEKNISDNSIIYKNTEGNIFKIPNAIPFWDCGERGDSITVEFKNYYNPQFIKVKPIPN